VPAPGRSPRKPTFAAIDFALKELGITSFADLDMGATYGEHALYAMDRPTVRSGVLADARAGRGRAQLLDAIEHAAERPGLRVVDGDAFDADTIAEIGEVDAVFLFNVLLHAVAPDWERVLEVYAAATSCFVIANPQWRGSAETVRLIDLGRDRYLETVPTSAANRDLFERLDDWSPAEQRLNRDSRTIWQWGITDGDLKAKLEELGFGLDLERSHGPFAGAEAFENKTFVFSRRDHGDNAREAAGDLDELRRSLARAEHERDELRRRVAKLERKLDDVLGSSSWKLTEPLRAAKRPFRRRR
jgi:hypothetical protein